MMEKQKIDTKTLVLIIIASVLLVAFAVVLIIPLTQGFNPFKLLFGARDNYNISESSEYRITNILEGLLALEEPELYPILQNEEDEFGDGGNFKQCNSYDITLESYNEPNFSGGNIEIYGSFGIRFALSEVELKKDAKSIFESAEKSLPDSILVRYYSDKSDGISHVSAVDFSNSHLLIEKLGENGAVTLASVSGDTWRGIFEKNGGTAILRMPDGSRFFDSGKYRFTLSLKQLQISGTASDSTVKTREEKTAVYTFSVNEHECSNGVLIANNASENMDFQLNVINEDGTVCYAPGSKVSIDDSLKLGVSISTERYEKILSASIINSGRAVKVVICKYDFANREYVEVESKDIFTSVVMNPNTIYTFDGADYETGKYKISFIYDSSFEHIEQEYEYYLVFGN